MNKIKWRIMTFEIIERTRKRLVFKTQHECNVVYRRLRLFAFITFVIIFCMTIFGTIMDPLRLEAMIVITALICLGIFFIHFMTSGNQMIHVTIDKAHDKIEIVQFQLIRGRHLGANRYVQALTKMTPLAINHSISAVKIECLYFKTRFWRWYINIDANLESIVELKKLIEDFLQEKI